MTTVVELVNEFASEIEGDLRILILKHSSIRRWNFPDSGIIMVGGDFTWEEVGAEGRAIQSKVMEQHRRFSAIVNTLTQAQPPKYLEVLKESEKSVREAIEQDTITYFQNQQEALDKTVEALHQQMQVVANLYGQASDISLFVPDTNALLHNPDLETWQFPNLKHFKIVLTTTVLSELDKHKVNHRVETVRQKAESLIGRIKGYRARGWLTEGVPLVRNRSEVMALAVEPDLTKSLPWLDKDNDDDHIIATILEVMRLNPRSPVMLVTRDINLQNKAEFAHLPFCEPPLP